MLGVLDIDFLEIDIEGADSTSPFYSLAAFLNSGEVPIGIVMSLLILNFWILAMLTYLVPLESKGVIHWIVIGVAFIISILITRIELMPLKRIFISSTMRTRSKSGVLSKECVLICQLNNDKIGQASIRRDGASLIFNVKSEISGEVFEKGETAYVSSQDEEKNIYYIRKTKG